MAYRVLMELVPRPDEYPEEAWAIESTDKVYVQPTAQVWVAKLTSGGQIWEYDNESDANSKMTELDNAALVRILTEPKNSLTKQYSKLFEMEEVEVDFRDDALVAVAQKAMERKTGARGLRSILEAVLLDTMYDLPSSETISKVVIDEGVITGESEPMLIYEGGEQAKAAPEE